MTTRSRSRLHERRRRGGRQIGAAVVLAAVGLTAASACEAGRENPDNRQEIEGRETPDTQRPPSTGAPDPDEDGDLTTTTAPGDTEGDEST